MQDDTAHDEGITPDGGTGPNRLERYALEIVGVVTDLWDERLEGWRIERLPGDNTRITGYVRDQSELYGVLAALRNMGLTLLRVEHITKPAPEEGVTS